METDNFNNSVIELRHKERMLRSSKSRSMTPVVKTASNNEDVTTVTREISSTRVSKGRKVVTSSTKSVSKTRNADGKVAVETSVEPSQENPKTPSVTHAKELGGKGKINGRGANSAVARGLRRVGTTAIRTSDYSSDEGEGEEEGQEEREARGRRVLDVYHGDYWNKFPKTDFTYSPASKDHRKEVAPGVSVKPNMSRASYRRAGQQLDSTTMSTTLASRRSRFFDANKAGARVPAYIADYAALDSDSDSVEVESRSRSEAVRSASFLSFLSSALVAVWTVVCTSATSVVETVWRRGRGSSLGVGYATPPPPPPPARRTRGWFARVLDSVYLLPAHLSAADLGLLSSTTSTTLGAEERPKRLRTFAGLMIFLLLLLCGWWLIYYATVHEGGATTASALLGDARTAALGLAGTVGKWCRNFSAWIFLPLAGRQAQQGERTPARDPGVVPPPTTTLEELAEAVVASDRFQQHLSLGRKGSGAEAVEGVLASPRFLEVVSSSRVNAEELSRELDQKSRLLDDREAGLAKVVARLKDELDAKLNASMADIRRNNEETRRVQEEEIRQLKARLQRCCDRQPPPPPPADVVVPWREIESYVAGLLGVSSTDKMADSVVGRRQLEAALANVSARHRAEMLEESERSAQTVMAAVSARLDSHPQHPQHHFHSATSSGSGLTDSLVMAMVQSAIATYDADKTGRVDFALESAGGSVVSTRCTESYHKHSASLTLFGIPYWYPVNTPRTVIQPGVHPGECWAFRGSQGFLVVQLAGLVKISSFSVEHIPRSLAFDGNIDSAPRDFSVWGLEAESDPEPIELGRFTFLKNGTSLQYFVAARTDVQPFRIIELRIDSNHGNLEYTCLYRFRVHGTWVSY